MICMRCWWENNPQISKPSSKCPKKTLSSPIFPRENPWKKIIFPYFSVENPEVLWCFLPHVKDAASTSAYLSLRFRRPHPCRARWATCSGPRPPCRAPAVPGAPPRAAGARDGPRGPGRSATGGEGSRPMEKGPNFVGKGWDHLRKWWYIYRERERLEYELFKNVYTCQIDDDSCIWKGISSIDSNGRYINKDWRMRMMADG